MNKNPVNDAEKIKNTNILPRSENQRLYIKALRDYDQVFAIGPAGSGKTFIPTMYALELYLKQKINKIILTRPAVEVGESHGFLPGDINRKLAPWVVPVTEIIEEVVGKQRFMDMLKSGDFEVAPFAYMRGRTFKDAFVILDEAQNTTETQMKMFVTRIGENTRMVICGDIDQNDMPGGRSGLQMAVNLIEQFNIPAAVVEFDSRDVVRSKTCKEWVVAFEKARI